MTMMDEKTTHQKLANRKWTSFFYNSNAIVQSHYFILPVNTAVLNKLPRMNHLRATVQNNLRKSLILGRDCSAASLVLEGRQHCTQLHQNHVSTPEYKLFSTKTSPTTYRQPGKEDAILSNDRSHSDEDKEFLISTYREKANKANIMLDDHQIVALKELDRLRNDILSSAMYTKKAMNSMESIGDGEESSFSHFPFNLPTLPNFLNMEAVKNLKSNSPRDSIKGIYLHGGVGCGKTFCMDLFFDNLPIESKQKVHFHKFMLDVHKQMHEAKMIKGVEGDVLPSVIDQILEQGLVICFDEFQVTDVADALILRRLFTGILDKGAIVVATSNRPPRDLYLNGLQRDLFLPFIHLLDEKNEVLSMWESETDYRLVQGINKARGVYFIGDEGKEKFNESFKELTKGSQITESSELTTQGRKIEIPRSSLKYSVARFSFDDLCRHARGAADYLIIGENFHTVFVEDVPELTMNDVNLVRRFIVFVDAMYECHVKLILHAATKADEIFQVDLNNKHCDEAFAFDRTRSRLEEMGSDEYLKSRWTGSEKKN